MRADLQTIVRVRELRMRLAQIEATRLRQAVSRAERALEEAQDIKASHEACIDSAYDLSDAQGFVASDAQGRMAYVAGMRLQIKDAEVQVRRANLARERAEEDSTEASRTYRDLMIRRETVLAELTRQRRKLRLRVLEREAEILAEDRMMSRRVALERGR